MDFEKLVSTIDEQIKKNEIEKNILTAFRECIEKQIPKQVKCFVRKPTKKIMGAGSCPICGGLVTEWENNCSRCGQRLDWSGER